MSSKNLSDLARIADFGTGLIAGLKYKSLLLKGEKIEYLEAGKGETIVFVHGFASMNAIWRYWLSHFKQNYRVIAVTIPDLTPSVQFNRSHYSFRNYAQWLDHFLAATNVDNCHLVSHCTGSCIAAFYASIYPEKLSSLTLMSTPEIRATNGRNIVNTFDRTDLVANANGIVLRSVMDRSFAKPPRIPKLLLNRVAATVADNSDKVMFLLTELSRSSAILLKRLSLIEVPTLLIGGQDDKYFSSVDAFEFYHQQIPHSELALLSDCGHFPLYEQQEQCVALVEKLIARNPLSKSQGMACHY